jgi:hypothetical protein
VRLIRVLLDVLDMNFVIFETCCQYFVKKKSPWGGIRNRDDLDNAEELYARAHAGASNQTL